MLLATAKAHYFPDRTFPRILATSQAHGLPAATAERLRTFWKQGYVDLKRRFDGRGEGKGIGDGAVAGCSPGEFDRAIEVRALPPGRREQGDVGSLPVQTINRHMSKQPL